jgi:hypothetical protein
MPYVPAPVIEKLGDQVKYLILFYLLILISGCAASGDRFSGLVAEQQDASTIYIYRPSKFFQGGTWPTVFIDGEERFTLKNNGYIHFSLPEGIHNIKIGSSSILSNWAAEDIEFDMQVNNGQLSFYRFDLEFGGVSGAGNYMSISGSVGLTEVDKETALKEMELLNSSM